MDNKSDAISGSARVSCSRLGGSDDGVRLQVTDETSGVRVVELRFTLGEFARVLTGEQVGSVRATWATGRVGWKRYTVHRVVEYAANATRPEREAAVDEMTRCISTISGALVTAHTGDVHNHHKWCKSSGAGVAASEVTFWLYFSPETTQAEQNRALALVRANSPG